MPKRTTQSLEKAPAHKKPVLLMVEDVKHFHKYVKTLMKYYKVNAELVSSFTIADGKEKILTAEPDFILTDYSLPDGYSDQLYDFMAENRIKIPYAIMTQFRSDELIDLGISVDFVNDTTALVFKGELGVWFGEYIQHLLDLSLGSSRWVDDE